MKNYYVLNRESDCVHVTAVRQDGVYGHSEEHCDPSGCAGNELFYKNIRPDAVEVGGLYEFRIDSGEIIAEMSR